MLTCGILKFSVPDVVSTLPEAVAGFSSIILNFFLTWFEVNVMLKGDDDDDHDNDNDDDDNDNVHGKWSVRPNV